VNPQCSTPQEKAGIAGWNWRIEFDGLLAVAEALRNSAPAMGNRALPGPVDYPVLRHQPAVLPVRMAVHGERVRAQDLHRRLPAVGDGGAVATAVRDRSPASGLRRRARRAPARLGLPVLARHHASLGGATIVSLYLQQAHGLRAGKVQMAIDCSIVLLALSVVEPVRIAYSVLAAVVMNLFIAVNHKPGRYAVL
jgi:hypothetical protein